jgi:hypothetical protein
VSHISVPALTQDRKTSFAASEHASHPGPAPRTICRNWSAELKDLILLVTCYHASLPARQRAAETCDTYPGATETVRLAYFAKAALHDRYPDRFWPDYATEDAEFGVILTSIETGGPVAEEFVRHAAILRYVLTVPDRDDLVSLCALAGNQDKDYRRIFILDRAWRRHAEGIDGLPPQPSWSRRRLLSERVRRYTAPGKYAPPRNTGIVKANRDITTAQLAAELNPCTLTYTAQHAAGSKPGMPETAQPMTLRGDR